MLDEQKRYDEGYNEEEKKILQEFDKDLHEHIAKHSYELIGNYLVRDDGVKLKVRENVK